MAEIPEELELLPDEPDEEIEELDPLEDDALADDFDDSLDALGDVDVVLDEDELAPPPGRSWAFDWVEQRFERPRNGRGALGTEGTETLRQWITKALHTDRGSSPVHSDGYGLEDGSELLGVPPDDPVFADLENRVRDCLTFHPLIADIENWNLEAGDPDEDIVLIDFTVILEDESELAVQEAI